MIRFFSALRNEIDTMKSKKAFAFLFFVISFSIMCMEKNERSALRGEECVRKAMMVAQKKLEEKLDATIAQRQQQEEQLALSLERIKSLLEDIEKLKAVKK
ncbi:MAG: hypothetical protein BWY54_00816 [Candidatus Dependentiae bacterium ADurb.Bin331]|nr:MAG: hypothetical protein BWY54_00816 [Candidatus Dependentiae bacterium ADurb.Bin331]